MYGFDGLVDKISSNITNTMIHQIGTNTTGNSGLDTIQSFADRMTSTMIHKIGENTTGNSGPKEKVFVFVPYNTSPQEQERIYQEVKSRIRDDSENEQFIYDNAIIQTNRGL